uniref:Fibronectin type-III domain-containing protein n=1 Tax=Magallana gigas TaxID=29159 RepID=A0A8W8NUD1_MAGGI
MTSDWEEKQHTPLQISCYVDGNPPPKIRLIRGQGNSKIIFEEQVDKWLNYAIESSQCYDSDNYICAGSSSAFNSSTKMFKINVLCKPRIDDSVYFKTIYGSKSGSNITVKVTVPLVANPAPELSNFTWVSPESQPNSTTILQGDVIYKHCIESTIEMYDRNHFGNYTLMYNGETVAKITIIPEDKPCPPVNVTVYYMTNGYINLTWISEFDGGLEQLFILSLQEGANWRVVANITDPGEGKLPHVEFGPLTPGEEHLFQLQSCNSINCSSFFDDIRVTVKGDEFAKTSLSVVFVFCFSVFGLLLIMVGIFVCFKITRGSFRQTGKPGDKNIDTKSHGMTQHYDDLHGTAREVAYTALGQSEMETTYEDM